MMKTTAKISAALMVLAGAITNANAQGIVHIDFINSNAATIVHIDFINPGAATIATLEDAKTGERLVAEATQKPVHVGDNVRYMKTSPGHCKIVYNGHGNCGYNGDEHGNKGGNSGK